MKTTQQLIELQRSITQGEWTLQQTSDATLDIARQSDGIRSVISRTHLKHLADEHGGSILANATAIALVPELLAEVIRLRQAVSR